MYEVELNELNKYILQSSKTVADYYDRLDSLTDKDKVYVIEKALAEIDVVIILTMNIRHQILLQLSTAPATVKIQMNQVLTELRTTADSSKTLSFNLTTVLNSVRDKLKAVVE